ncbi:hypothetical protein GCM10008018_41890 [Paenibacillus marchantiophytorum]|uniref:Uncharacterized protein n=1 Tax=Paenibacillus marchantiophytorum TaxID=1619310 RepID=A0ABQ1EX20_9BACL|nr:hypothetical protein GCM10008018_41890 [Paenibacillus marchantiophytorum]
MDSEQPTQGRSGIHGNPAKQISWTLQLLWCVGQHKRDHILPKSSQKTGTEVEKPKKSEDKLHGGKVRDVHDPKPISETTHNCESICKEKQLCKVA